MRWGLLECGGRGKGDKGASQRLEVDFLGNLDQSSGRTEKMVDWTSFVPKGALFLFRD